MDNTKDPKRFSDCNETINSWDENIFLGTDYQTGTVADFENHPGPYILSFGVQENFLPDLREMAKKYHGTRIKAIERGQQPGSCRINNYLLEIK